MKLGIDLGNGWTNFEGMRFASAVAPGKLPRFGEKQPDVHQVKFEETYYVVGRIEDGSFLGDDRYTSENYKICLLTAIALASKKRGLNGKVKAEICVGLPINLYNEGLGDVLAEHIKGYKTQTIEVNGEEYDIQIKSVVVFPEGALVILDGDMGSVLTIDIGAGTVNVIEWENGRPKDFKTLTNSMLNMYSRISNYLNELGISFENRQIEKLLYSEERIVYVNQEAINVDKAVDSIIKSTVGRMASEINTHFNVKAISKLRLLGGGAIPTLDAWREKYPTITISNNSQFVNSEIFDMIAKSV